MVQVCNIKPGHQNPEGCQTGQTLWPSAFDNIPGKATARCIQILWCFYKSNWDASNSKQTQEDFWGCCHSVDTDWIRQSHKNQAQESPWTLQGVPQWCWMRQTHDDVDDPECRWWWWRSLAKAGVTTLTLIVRGDHGHHWTQKKFSNWIFISLSYAGVQINEYEYENEYLKMKLSYLI